MGFVVANNGVSPFWIIMVFWLTLQAHGENFGVARTRGKEFQIRCQNKYGYLIGGGSLKRIQPITSPNCQRFSNALSVIGDVQTGKQATTALLASASLITPIAPAAQVLSAALSVFSLAFGQSFDDNKPTANDILDEVDRTFAVLTNEVNHRFMKMQQYVDKRIIESEKKTMFDEYLKIKKYYTSCVREVTKSNVDKCQAEALRKMNANSVKFMSMYIEYHANEAHKNYDGQKIRRLEVSLLIFRDFASLHIMALQIAINTYKNDSGFPNRIVNLNRYLGELRSIADDYYQYVRWVEDTILWNQVGRYMTTDGKSLSGYGYESGKITNLFDGDFFSTNVKPKCQFKDPLAPYNECNYLYIIASHRHGEDAAEVNKMYTGDVSFNVFNTNQKEVLNVALRRDVPPICLKYLLDLEKDIKTYWSNQFDEVLNTWKQLSDKAAKSII